MYRVSPIKANQRSLIAKLRLAVQAWEPILDLTIPYFYMAIVLDNTVLT